MTKYVNMHNAARLTVNEAEALLAMAQEGHADWTYRADEKREDDRVLVKHAADALAKLRRALAKARGKA